MSSTSVDTETLARVAYDEGADRYIAWKLSVERTELKFLPQLVALLPPPAASRVLELGCGAGVPYTKYLAEHCGHVMGCDISAKQVERARANFAGAPHVEIVESSMLELDAPAGSFDAVAGFYSLVHLSRDQQAAVVAKIKRWLKPGGYLLCNFAEREYAEKIWPDWLGMRVFASSRGTEGSIAMIKDAGFEIVTAEVLPVVKDEAAVWIIAKAKEGEGE